MRLIDADEIRYTSLEDGFGRIKECIAFSTDIDKAPTVNAIPIEWILKWACEFVEPNSEGYKMAMELVHDWRKENE